MSRNHRIVGYCRICRTHGPLTFEHVPPRSSFNRRPVLRGYISDWINTHPNNYTGASDRDLQSGAGAYTLCGSCNNKTGSWYARSFSEWVFQCARLLDNHREERGRTTAIRFEIYPLRVIKQICAMVLSLNSDEFRVVHGYLADFVLEKKKIGLDPRIRVSAYLTHGPNIRFATGMKPYKFTSKHKSPQELSERLAEQVTDAEKTMVRHEYPSEIGFPPLGYAITLGPNLDDDARWDISHFGLWDYDTKALMWVDLPVLPVHTWYYGDYRTLGEIGDPPEEGGRSS